jgi:hypothetical protein
MHTAISTVDRTSVAATCATRIRSQAAPVARSAATSFTCDGVSMTIHHERIRINADPLTEQGGAMRMILRDLSADGNKVTFNATTGTHQLATSMAERLLHACQESPFPALRDLGSLAAVATTTESPAKPPTTTPSFTVPSQLHWWEVA